MTARRVEYVEGQKATENFEEGMKALFEVSKERVVKAAKKKTARSAKKQELSDKD